MDSSWSVMRKSRVVKEGRHEKKEDIEDVEMSVKCEV